MFRGISADTINKRGENANNKTIRAYEFWEDQIIKKIQGETGLLQPIPMDNYEIN